MLKRIIFAFIILLAAFESNGQSGVIVKAKPYQLKKNEDTTFMISLIVTNNTSGNVSVPEYPKITDDREWVYIEVGVDIRYKSKRINTCRIAYDDFVEPKMLLIKPGETKEIIASFPGACFEKKGEYKVKFSFMIPSPKDRYRTFSSRPVKFRIT